MQYLLDTNTCIAVMRNHAQVLQRLAAVRPGECAISTISSYELYTGVEKCADPAREGAKVDLLLKTVHQVPFDSAAAKEAARVRAALESQGQPIGPYDLGGPGLGRGTYSGKREHARVQPGHWTDR